MKLLYYTFRYFKKPNLVRNLLKANDGTRFSKTFSSKFSQITTCFRELSLIMGFNSGLYGVWSLDSATANESYILQVKKSNLCFSSCQGTVLATLRHHT